jgi:hypothetical protein
MTAKPESDIWFPRWAEVLARLPLPPLRRQQYRQAILRYLSYCKTTRQRATVASAREASWIAGLRERHLAERLESWREAIRWFFRAAPQRERAPACDEAFTARRAPLGIPSGRLPDGTGKLPVLPMPAAAAAAVAVGAGVFIQPGGDGAGGGGGAESGVTLR